MCAHIPVMLCAWDAGQCNDAFFRMSKKKAVTFILDTPVALDETGVLCKSGSHLPVDMIVNASGCKFDARPAFLQKLGLGEFQALFEPGTGRVRQHCECIKCAVYNMHVEVTERMRWWVISRSLAQHILDGPLDRVLHSLQATIACTIMPSWGQAAEWAQPAILCMPLCHMGPRSSWTSYSMPSAATAEAS